MKFLIITQLENGQYAVQEGVENAQPLQYGLIAVRDEIGPTYSFPNSVLDEVMAFFKPKPAAPNPLPETP